MIRFLKKIWLSILYPSPSFITKKILPYHFVASHLNYINAKYSAQYVLLQIQRLCNAISFYYFFYILFGNGLIKGLFLDIFLCTVACASTRMILIYKKKLRKNTLKKEMPHFLDSLSFAINSGLNFIHAFKHVITTSKNEIAIEAQDVIKEIEFGLPETEALMHFGEKLEITELKTYISSLIQAKQLGVSMAKTLQVQSNMLTTKQRQKAEEMSRTASVKISIPLVFFIFPALLIVYLAPGILRFIQ